MLADLLLSPAVLALLALALAMLGRRGLTAAVLGVLVLLSLPVVAVFLVSGLRAQPVTAAAPPQAVVILSESAGADAPEVPGLDRLRTGSELACRGGLPILVTGREAPRMAGSLAEDFHCPARWQEGRSRTVWDEAQLAAPILREAGISRVYLITAPGGMRRAMLAFRHFGLEVTPVLRAQSLSGLGWAGFVPRAESWRETSVALHEWLRLGFYTLRARMDRA